MPLYKKDPNNSSKQVPNIQGDNRHDRISSPTRFVKTKSPNFIIVNGDISDGLGFHFNPTQFSSSAVAENPGNATIYSSSAGYNEFNSLKTGTYNFHPIAVSGSANDVAKIRFIYKSGLATGGF